MYVQYFPYIIGLSAGLVNRPGRIFTLPIFTARQIAVKAARGPPAGKVSSIDPCPRNATAGLDKEPTVPWQAPVDMFKVGMTRREQYQERVDELGDASVPFPFDVHMMISCDDAPTLENALHKELHKRRVNKVNFRKEFFYRVDLEAIRRIAEAHNGKVVEFRVEPEASDYREGKKMCDEDYEFVERTQQTVREEEGIAGGED